MRHRLHLSALIVMSLIGATSQAFAQGTGAGAGATGGGVAPGMGGVPPVGTTPTNPGSAGITTAPGGTSTTTTGMGTGGVGTGTNLNSGISQPGAPNTSVPGSIGTGASPSGLLGDDPAHPGFPGRVGQ